MAHFNLPECEDPAAAAKLRVKVKQWTLKKMAEMFRVWKKILWKNYWCVDQLGTPRVSCDEHNGKFSLSYETKV
jgi:hypothetical protein